MTMTSSNRWCHPRWPMIPEWIKECTCSSTSLPWLSRSALHALHRFTRLIPQAWRQLQQLGFTCNLHISHGPTIQVAGFLTGIYPNPLSTSLQITGPARNPPPPPALQAGIPWHHPLQAPQHVPRIAQAPTHYGQLQTDQRHLAPSASISTPRSPW